MYNKTHEQELTGRRKTAHTLLVVFGCICGAISFVMSCIEIGIAFTEDEPAGEEIANPLNSQDMTQINLNNSGAGGLLRF